MTLFKATSVASQEQRTFSSGSRGQLEIKSRDKVLLPPLVRNMRTEIFDRSMGLLECCVCVYVPWVFKISKLQAC